MNESYDLANHLLVIAFVVFYWRLLRIWQQPPPHTQDDTAGKKTAAAEATNLAGVALRQLTAHTADAVSQPGIAPAAALENPLAAIRAADDSFDEAAFFFADESNNQAVDPQLTAATNLAAPNFAPQAGSPVLSAAGAAPTNGFFEATSFAGAIGTLDWTAGWTAYPAN